MTLLATIEDFHSRRVGGGFGNDLNVALGVGVGSLWSRQTHP